IDAQDAVEILDWKIERHAGQARPRIGDDAVDGAERLLRRVEARDDGGFVLDVHGDGRAAGKRFEPVHAPRAGGDLGAGGRAEACEMTPKPRRRAGDQDRAPNQIGPKLAHRFTQSSGAGSLNTRAWGKL